MRHLILALALVASHRGLAAQDSASVRVTVSTAAGPLGDALVQSGTLKTRTDQSGFAALRLERGTRTLVVARIGYVPDTLSLVLLPGLDTMVSVVLAEQPAELEEIVVASTRSDRRVEDQPLRVEVLAREEVEEKLLMTPGDIAMLLNETGGLRVQNTSPSLGGANVRVQGLRGRYTLLLSDGLPLYGGQVGGLGLLQVPPMDLGQVEVIKGAASALYGSSALGGVINLVSRRPVGEREILLNGTTLGGLDGVVWTSGTVSRRWGYTLLGSAHRQGRVDRDDDGWTDVPGYERAVFRPRVFWEDGTGRSVFFTAGVTREDREGGTVGGAVAPDGRVYAENLTTTRIDVGSVGRFPVGTGLLLSVRGSLTHQRHLHRFGQVPEPDRHGTQFGEAALSRTTARNVWVLGLSLQGEQYRAKTLPAFDYSYVVPSLFVHDELTISDRLSVAVSARLDHHSEYGTFVHPRISALMRMGRSWTARTSFGTGFYGPTPFTEDTEVTGLSRLVPPTDLRAESARSGSVDVGGAIGPVEVNGTLFGSVIDPAVQLRESPSATGAFELFNAEGPTRTYGGELLARLRHEPFHLTMNYTYTRSTEPAPEGGDRRDVALTPRHSVGVVGIFEQEQRLRMGFELYYTGRQALDDNPYRQNSRPYVILGALLERHIGPARLFVNVENITDVRQTKYDRLVLPERAPDGRWTTDAWAPLEGRVVNGGVRFSF